MGKYKLNEKYLKPIKNLIPELEQVMLDLSISKYPFITESVHYLIKSGGKRIRPIILLLSAGAAGIKNLNKIIPLAAGVELLHTATLVHDDVMDRSPLRRGKTTLHEIHGNKTSILVGDFLYARAIQIFVDYGNIEIIKCISNATTKLCEGETYQNLRQGDMHIDEKSYFDIITYKTGSLIQACGEIGAIAAGSSDKLISSLKKFALKIGIIFQISDDMLDIWSNSNVMGKENGNDIVSGKMTLPLIHLINKVNSSTKQKILKKLSSVKPDITELKNILSEFNAEKYCKNTIDKYYKDAVNQLDFIENNKYKKALLELSDSIIKRKK